VVRELDNPNLRQLVVGRYRLIYRVESGGVGIVRLVHGARDQASLAKAVNLSRRCHGAAFSRYRR